TLSLHDALPIFAEMILKDADEVRVLGPGHLRLDRQTFLEVTRAAADRIEAENELVRVGHGLEIEPRLLRDRLERRIEPAALVEVVDDRERRAVLVVGHGLHAELP